MTKPHRRYTPTQQFGTMLLALNEGIVAAEQKTKTPQSTIYTWFRRAGGIAEVRRFAEEAAGHALSKAEQAVYEWFLELKAAKGITEEEGFRTLRQLFEARLGSQEKTGVNINLTQQQAQGVDGRNLNAAEAAYLATLRGQPSIESGPNVSLPTLPLSSNGADGSLPSEDSE
jgi:hypothetical protein